MSPWISQFFLNPAFFLPGIALVSVPIIIHLINRLRHRRVRFAAMEFLLASEQKNRRRILLEQLLLLLLRILLVLLLVALLARLVLEPSQLSLFQGARSHHLVLLDDSGSMRDRLGEDSAFEEARAVILRLVAEGARRPGSQKFTLLLASAPEETFSGFTERPIDDALLDELTTRLDDLQPTYGDVDFTEALRAAQDRLTDDPTDLKQLHVVSDFREGDWFDNEALATTLRTLDAAGVAVNLVRTVEGQHENLAITGLEGKVTAAAAGIPVDFEVQVANFGTREAENVRVGVSLDGRRLPLSRSFERIAPGEEVSGRLTLRFERAGLHRVQVHLESDSLPQDNTRYVAVHVPEQNPVLIIDGSPGGDEAQYVADALAADPSVTGFAPVIDGPDSLRRMPLERFQLIYMVNVPELPADALAALQKYVADGGGLVWFLGDGVNPAFYNAQLYRAGEGLFPAPLGEAPRRLPRDPSARPRADIVIGEHPMFEILAGEDNPFIDLVFVNDYYPVETADSTLAEDAGAAEVIARLRNRDPLILEHRFGDGRVITCLTAAGPLRSSDGLLWNNWASGPAAPSYVVFQLDLAKHVARRDRSLPTQTVGEPIREVFSRVVFYDRVEIVTPDNQVTQVIATDLAEADEDGEVTVRPLEVVFRETGRPGIYAVRKTAKEQEVQETWIACNVPVRESDLAVIADEQMRRTLGEMSQLTIQPPGQFDWIRSEAPGQEVRWWLLALLLLVGVCEQALAYRLSYHPE